MGTEEGGVEQGNRVGQNRAKGQMRIIDQALETAALMLGTDNSRGYCLEMICADFLAGANLENGNPQVLLESLVRFFNFLPREDQQRICESI